MRWQQLEVQLSNRFAACLFCLFKNFHFHLYEPIRLERLERLWALRAPIQQFATRLTVREAFHCMCWLGCLLRQQSEPQMWRHENQQFRHVTGEGLQATRL